MNNKELILLLQIIDTNGNIKRMLHEGVSFRQIANLTNSAIASEYLQYTDEKITLTEQGRNFLKIELPKLKKKKKEDWIQPDFKSKIRQIDRNDIFLPRENDLSF